MRNEERAARSELDWRFALAPRSSILAYVPLWYILICRSPYCSNGPKQPKAASFMATTLTYGKGASCMLESNRITHLQPALDESTPISELPALVCTALARPINFPPFASCTAPGDRVVVALGQGLPCFEQLVEGMLATLREAGVETSSVTMLLSGTSEQESALRDLLVGFDAEDISIEVHDPDDERQCSFLGVAKTGRPLRLNRTLCDADLVVPLGVCSLSTQSEDRCAKFNSLFPHFSDRETIDRYHAPIAMDSKVHRSERLEEMNEVGWMLGVGLGVQVVPGPRGGIATLMAGEPSTLADVTSTKYREIWSRNVDSRGNLVVATLAGEAPEQSWQNLGRALEAAERVLEPGGVIVVCSELAQLPGPSLRRLMGNESYEASEREIMRDRFADSWPAMLLCRALEQGTIYLRSRLPAEVVESLGMAPITAAEEIERLVQAHDHCVVLEEAQRLLPMVVEPASGRLRSPTER